MGGLRELVVLACLEHVFHLQVQGSYGDIGGWGGSQLEKRADKAATKAINKADEKAKEAEKLAKVRVYIGSGESYVYVHIEHEAINKADKKAKEAEMLAKVRMGRVVVSCM